MKMRIIKLSPEFLIERLIGKTSTLTSNLPNDVELLDIKYDQFTRQVQAIVRSNNFEDVPETYPIPEFNLVYSATPKTSTPPPTLTQKTAPSPTASLQMEPKQTAAFKPEPVTAKKTTIPHKSDTSMVEEEFSSDQRKLLSFSMNGDFVIVKPVKFLKAEWDDINEVVRSIGGRWVKGDIISYWEIPIQRT
jgi:hypothetical protein